MIVELKSKSQVTIPKEIVNSMDLNQGDQFEIVEENGRIVLVPIVSYPQELINNLKLSVKDIKESIEKGEQPVFDSIDALIEDLEK